MAPLLALTGAMHALFMWGSSTVIDGRRYFILFDDAAISMRYAANLAAGAGLRWNPGEPAVEGITNPLWAVWMAVLHLIGLPDRLAGLGVMITSSALLLGSVVLAARVTHRLAPQLRLAPPATAVLTATAYPLAYWSLRGMEVGAVAFGVLAAVSLTLGMNAGPTSSRRLHLLGILLVAVIAIRLDAAVLAGPLAVWCAWRAPTDARRRTAVVLGAWLVVGVAAMTAARLVYYGDLLPNTYYLKSTGVPLGDRLHLGALTLAKGAVSTLVAPVATAAGGAVALVTRRRPADAVLIVGLLALQAGYSTWVGGDAWETVGYANRYISTVLPLLAVLGGVGIAAIAQDRRGTSLPATLGVAGAGCLALAAWGREVPFRASGVTSWGPWRVPLIALGLALLAGCVAVAIVGRRAGRPNNDGGRPVVPSAMAAVAALTAIVALAANGHALLDWQRGGPAYSSQDAIWTRQGLLLRECTRPGTTVGVFAAGQIIYFSDRLGVDLLGKTDEVVARSAPHPGNLRPGHIKWDYDRSIGELRPDVVTDTGLGLPSELVEHADDWGYDIIGGWMVHRNTDGVDRKGLARGIGGGGSSCDPG